MKKFELVEAWQFLNNHKAFCSKFVDPSDNSTIYKNRFSEALDIDFVKVNPETDAIDDDETKNTLVQVWLECGRIEYVEELEQDMVSHDVDLDCGGATFEDAIIMLAGLVLEHYGEDPIY